MTLTELWSVYEADKRILGFSPHTLKAYALQVKVLVREVEDLEIEEIYLNLLKEYLAKQSDRLKPNSLGHRIRFIRSLFRFAFEEGYVAKNPTLKIREPRMDKRIPKFLIEEDVIHLKISCTSHREHALPSKGRFILRRSVRYGSSGTLKTDMITVKLSLLPRVIQYAVWQFQRFDIP